MPLNAFIVRPFAVKELVVSSAEVVARLKGLHGAGTPGLLVGSIDQIGDTPHWKVRIDFEEVHRRLIRPTMDRLRIHGETASAVVVAGNIREEMFNRLVTADLVIADVSIHNPNVFYELGIRQAFRDKYTFLIRSDLSEYPFDLKTDRYFEYGLIELMKDPEQVVKRLSEALRATLSSNEADSPIFKLLPQLEAEDRARFIAVPEEFREEVERARHHQQREHLGLLAVECEGYLWEIEGLRVVGRAQFESNFVEGAKLTWEQIVGRYPEDVEANTLLSTIYQRLGDFTRSEQALARASRVRSLTPGRLSQLRSLSGRNLKEAWIAQWREPADRPERDGKLERQQRRALSSPLLQRACDAYQEAFKADLNNSYAGLNALTLLVIQVELAQAWWDDWRRVQRQPGEAERELELRRARIRQLISALELAVESDRERLVRQGLVDPWFSLLEASVMCIVSAQPDHVAQLFEAAKHYAPLNAEGSMRRGLEVYSELRIGGRDFDPTWEIGTIFSNVQRAFGVLSEPRDKRKASPNVQRILMFVGLRLDHTISAAEAGTAGAADSRPVGARQGFPEGCVDAAREAIKRAVLEEIGLGGDIAFGMASGANGGDLLFHDVCGELKVPTRMCLALPRPQYVGQYVAPAGREWMQRFSVTHRRLRSPQTAADDRPAAHLANPITVFTDSNELPRWLQGKPFYNVGRRNNLWMLQHAVTAAGELGDNAEITLLALWKPEASEGGIGGIGDVIKHAVMQGIKVHVINVPAQADAAAGKAAPAGPKPAPHEPHRPNGKGPAANGQAKVQQVLDEAKATVAEQALLRPDPAASPDGTARVRRSHSASKPAAAANDAPMTKAN